MSTTAARSDESIDTMPPITSELAGIESRGGGAPTYLRPTAAKVAGGLRIAYGLTFLWAFFDKLFGWHFATPGGKGWIAGGNPTLGFLTGSAKGPFAGFYKAIAGTGAINWLFMVALLGIGVALTLGIGMRLAAASGVVLYLMMWSVTLPPATNPLLDDHVLGAIALALLALIGAGYTWGFAARWARTDIVKRFPVLR